MSQPVDYSIYFQRPKTTAPTAHISRNQKGAQLPDTPATRMFRGQRHPKNRKKYIRLEQWAEIRIINGKTVTTLHPSNEDLIRKGQAMLPPPDRVIRRLHFPDGIPPEYEWTGVENEDHRKYGGLALQRMTVDMWLDAMKREAENGGGHLSPVFNLPPFKRECDCPTCRHNEALLEELENKAREANKPFDTDSLVRYATDQEEL